MFKGYNYRESNAYVTGRRNSPFELLQNLIPLNDSSRLVESHVPGSFFFPLNIAKIDGCHTDDLGNITHHEMWFLLGFSDSSRIQVQSVRRNQN